MMNLKPHRTAILFLIAFVAVAYFSLRHPGPPSPPSGEEAASLQEGATAPPRRTP